MRAEENIGLMSVDEYENIRWAPGERLHHLFESSCDSNGESAAVITGGAAVTYASLDGRANQIARYLAESGIRPGSRVGIHLERSIYTYECLLAVLKAGCAFVPIDPSFPAERKLFIAEDASLSAILTASGLEQTMTDAPCPQISLDLMREAISGLSTERLAEDELGQQPDDGLCYIIYTSGSSGNPKGVAVDHSSICNFVRVAREVYGIEASDRVYQGMITAFDFSIEEIWPALIRGAAIVPGPTGANSMGAGLSEFLIDNGITVLCCVPTLLATIDRDIPSLRLLLVGGEACPQHLVERWEKKGLRMLNTYGPTEATVTATWGELKAGCAVTIGKAMPTYTVYILDDNREPLPAGEVGEICIAGPGVARGYVNRDDLTEKVFIPDHLGSRDNPTGRIYRTGDLGRLRTDGDIEYLGRADTQVKIRGFRIELSEIESALLEVPGVENCVVSTWLNNDIKELAAYVQLKPGSETFDREEAHRMLAERLPAYMVPAYLEVVPLIPLLANGKADRKELPKPKGPRLGSSSKESIAPSGPIEEKIASFVEKAFHLEKPSVEDDFFQNLGGHSLIVARLVSMMRKDPELSSLGLSDIYKYPTVRALAGYIEKTLAEKNSELEPEDDSVQRRPVTTYPGRKVWQCGLGQAASVYLSIAVFSMPWLLIFGWMLDLINQDQPDYISLSGLFLLGIGISLLMSLMTPIALKWALLGRVRPGEHQLWGWFFLRWWFVQKATALSPLALLSGTPFINIYLRLMGARIGRDCLIETPLLHMCDLIDIKNGTSIGANTHIFGYVVRDGKLIFAPVTIGRACHIGSNSVVMPGAVMEDNAWLGDQSLLPEHQRVPALEIWSGSPAQKEAEPSPEVVELAGKEREPLNRIAQAGRLFGFAVGALALIILPVIAAAPGTALMFWAYLTFKGGWYLMTAPVAGVLFVVMTSLEVALMKKLVLSKMEPGTYPVDGFIYLRKWFVDKLMAMSLAMTNSIYATLYLPPFLRLLGVKIGKRSEVSTISQMTPNLLTIGDESFIADIASVGASTTHNGFFIVRHTKIGRRSFIGNAAFVPCGTSVSDESLIGVLSVPPREDFKPGTTWLGSPAINLPQRQESQKFPEELTYTPTPVLYAKRLSYELFRVSGPATLYAFSMGLLIAAFADLLEAYPLSSVALIAPFILLGTGLALTLFVALVKKILIGAYRPLVRPMWSTFVWRTELVTALYESVVVPALMKTLTGTPFAAPVLRLLGADIGNRCYLETTYLTEFDLVSVGDDCSIGQASSLQTHLFEDRVMKMSRLEVKDRSTVGPRAVVLYDSTLEEETHLDALSLAMKGETLPSGSGWRGVPARKNSVSGKVAQRLPEDSRVAA